MTGFIIAAVVFITTVCVILQKQNREICERDNAMRAYYKAKREYYERRNKEG